MYILLADQKESLSTYIKGSQQQEAYEQLEMSVVDDDNNHSEKLKCEIKQTSQPIDQSLTIRMRWRA